MKFRGLTLVELLIGITVLSITVGIVALSAKDVGKQTAKNEAEKVLSFINSKFRQADVIGAEIKLSFINNSITSSVYDIANNNYSDKITVLSADKNCTYNLRDSSGTIKHIIYYKPVTRKTDNITISQDSFFEIDNDTQGQCYILIKGADEKNITLVLKQ